MSDNRSRRAIGRSIRVGIIVSLVPMIGFADTNSSSDAQAITAGGARAITAGGARAITAGGARAITAGGARAITAGGARAITAGGARAITAGGARAITAGGTRLVVYGRVDVVGSDFLSVLGQTVFASASQLRGVGAGSMVAVFGSIDFATGGIVNATVMDGSVAGISADSGSYLTGFVDSVDQSMGLAVVSGVTVDYNALLSSGYLPSVGDQVSVTGRAYRDIGLLVADPQMRLELR